MADNIKGASSELKELRETISKLSQSITDLGRSTGPGARSMKDLAAGSRTVTEEMKKAEDSVKNFADSVKNVASTTVTQWNNLASGVPTNEIVAQFNKIDERWKANRKVVMDVGLAWRNEFGKIKNSADAIDYRMSQLSADLYTDLGDIQKAAASLGDFFDVDTIFEPKKFGAVTMQLGLVEAGMRMAMATGTDVNDVMSFMKTTIAGLGAESKDAAGYFALIAQRTKDAGMSMKAFFPILQGIAKQYEMYGLDVKGATDETANISLAMGKQKGLVSPLASAMMTGFHNMSISGEAFFGLMGGMKGASQGAIEAALSFEQAISGEMGGVGDAVTSVSKTISNLFGPVMDRATATRTGKGTQYIQQRGFVEQQMGMDKATANKFLQFLAARDRGETVSGGKNVEQELTKMLDTQGDATKYAKETTTELKKLSLEMMNLYSQARKSPTVSFWLQHLRGLQIGGAALNVLNSIWKAIVAGIAAYKFGGLGVDIFKKFLPSRLPTFGKSPTGMREIDIGVPGFGKKLADVGVKSKAAFAKLGESLASAAGSFAGKMSELGKTIGGSAVKLGGFFTQNVGNIKGAGSLLGAGTAVLAAGYAGLKIGTAILKATGFKGPTIEDPEMWKRLKFWDMGGNVSKKKQDELAAAAEKSKADWEAKKAARAQMGNAGITPEPKQFGGVVSKPTLILAGEGGRPERISPVSAEGGNVVRIVVDIKDGIKTIAQKVVDYNISTQRLVPGKMAEMAGR